ncbi:uncharacterized protein LOC143894827 [Temnothorax americanus]|uniref:uncharacterized protein LOC143894827 n=1 Tax=Temnothorax americanus TaxID=1964332 RepID=UPI0040687A46
MTENVTKSHNVMPEGLQPNVNIDEQTSNTSPVTDNLIQNQMSDELQDDQNSNVSESGVITVEMTENVTKSHSVMPEGLQPNVNIDEQTSNTSPVTDNLIQNQMSDELQGLYTILRFCIILVYNFL